MRLTRGSAQPLEQNTGHRFGLTQHFVGGQVQVFAFEHLGHDAALGREAVAALLLQYEFSWTW